MTPMTRLTPRLDVVVLGVRDLAGVRSFYQKLGWRYRPRDGVFARFELGDVALVLFPLDILSEVIGLKPSDGGEVGGFKGCATAMMVETPAALGDALAVVVAAGGRVLAEPADRPWGVRTAYFADPENNTWELCCFPA
jgi:uncharacterized protein